MCVCVYIIYMYIYVQNKIPRRTPFRVKMSPPRAGTAVLQQTPETLSSYAFSKLKKKDALPIRCMPVKNMQENEKKKKT